MRINQGSILIVALWGLILFSIISVSLTFCAMQDLVLMKREAESIKKKTDFLSAFNIVQTKISDDPAPYDDSPQDAWHGRILSAAPLEENIQIEVEDEESKINLNFATRKMLEIFFKKFESEAGPLAGDKKEYVKAVAGLRASGKIDSLEELLLVEEFKAIDYLKLKKFLTVYPDTAQININTSPPIVIESLIESIPGDEAAKRLFSQRLFQTCLSKKGCFFLHLDLTPALFLKKLKLPDNSFMTSFVQEFLAAVTTDSCNFELDAVNGRNEKVEVVFKIVPGAVRPEILRWNEV